MLDTITVGVLVGLLICNGIDLKAAIMTDSGWECDETGVDAIYYNSKTNVLMLTRKLGNEHVYVNCDDGHSGFSIKMTQAILNRLIDMQPLTPIEDTDDAWNKCPRIEDGPEIYQCKRMSSLFKLVYTDGTVEYHDNDIPYCVDINNPDVTYSSGLVRRIINEMYPITMPYMPGKPIKVYCEDFLVDKKNGDFDTIGIFYAIKTENGEQEKIEISRFFKTQEDLGLGCWEEISKKEYYERKDRQINN